MLECILRLLERCSLQLRSRGCTALLATLLPTEVLLEGIFCFDSRTAASAGRQLPILLVLLRLALLLWLLLLLQPILLIEMHLQC